MPPVKHVTTKDLNGAALSGKTIATRVRNQLATLKEDDAYPKRKAQSPIKGKTTKRPAFVDITNAISAASNSLEGKKTQKKTVKRVSTLTKPTTSSINKTTQKSTAHIVVEKVDAAKNSNFAKPTASSTNRITRSTVVSVTKKDSTSLKPVLPTSKPVKHEPVASKKPVSLLPVPVLPNIRTTTKEACDQKTNTQPVASTTVRQGPVTRRTSGRLSNGSEKTDESSLYVSALESLLGRLDMSVNPTPAPAAVVLLEPEIDIDKEMSNDPFQVSIYAHHIFSYLKSRESNFEIDNYMERQPYITKWMRSMLVDWMVEVQENFELNHETLYLAVKLVDLFMSRQQINKETLQLLGAVSIFIAAKFDERIPPSIEDFIYICDGVYKRKDVTKMEVNVLKVIDFDLGIPLSYRFLRRYARCAKVQMPLLTLARYILEYSLMDYSIITLSDSKLAAAALLLAFKMTNHGEWSNTLQYFTGYKIEDIKDIVHQLNGILHKKPKDALSTVKNKYSHKIFFEVAKTPLIDDLDL